MTYPGFEAQTDLFGRDARLAEHLSVKQAVTDHAWFDSKLYHFGVLAERLMAVVC